MMKNTRRVKRARRNTMEESVQRAGACGLARGPGEPPRQAADLETPAGSEPRRRRLTEEDAVAIWIARWLRVKRRELAQRFDCDARRLYEIWQEERFPGSRERAMELFRDRYPGLVDRIDYGPHRRNPRHVSSPEQLSLFAEDAPAPATRARRRRSEHK
jgi:hypothetical protein